MKHPIYGALETWSNKNRDSIDRLLLEGDEMTEAEVLDIVKEMGPILNIPPDKDTPKHILEQIFGDVDTNMIRNVGRNY